MSEVNKIKDKEQKKALNAWAKAGFIASIIAGTGFGKSRAGVLAIDYILKQKSRSNQKSALILVPTIQLQKQFIEEFSKWDLDHCLDNVSVLCYQSAYKLIGHHYDIVVCDEVHLGLSPKYRKFFENNVYDSLLCMTATLPEEEEYRDILKDLAPIVYEINLDECVSLGIIAPYSINCIPIKLTNQEQADYKKANNQFIYHTYSLGQFDAFNKAKEILGNKQSTPEDRASAAGFYKAIRERKSIVDFASNKILEFQRIYDENTDKKILVFSGANDFTDTLCESIAPYALAYHSNKTKKQKEQSLEAFKLGLVNVLCSTKALNQGFDVPNANMGIICGITSKGLTMIQRIGRLLRFEEGKSGEIIILYVKNSQEEKWLKNSVKGLDNVNWL